MELVSVIVGTYNGAEYIEAQLQSIIGQTYSELEIIIVDDASQDDTVPTLTSFAKKHNNISIHNYTENVGYIKNFERGIALAKGNFIALSDQDDWWEPTKIEQLKKQLKNNDLIYCDSAFVDENLKPLGKSFSTIKNMISSKNPINFLIDNCVSGHAMLFKKELFNKAIPFPELIPHDWWLTYIASVNNGVSYFDKPLIKYRHHQNNVIASMKKKAKNPNRLAERRHRIEIFHKACPEMFIHEKRVISAIHNSYKKFSFTNNLKRVILFLRNQKELLPILKKSTFKKTIFSINMFFKLK